MDIFVLNANKMCKYDQIIKYISFNFPVLLSWLYFVQKGCQDVTPTLFVYLSVLYKKKLQHTPGDK